MSQAIARLVEQACSAESNAFGYGIWTHHIQEVVHLAKELALDAGADLEVVELAALLHDYAAVKDEHCRAAHHLHGATEAETLLQRFGYPQKTIDAVKTCIVEHRASVPGTRTTPEARCLASADALAHLFGVPSLLYYAYTHAGLGIDEGRVWVRDKLTRSFDKLEPDLQRRVRGRYQAALTTLEA